MIYIINGTGSLNHKIVGALDSYQSLIWNVQYYGVNDFELNVAATQENVDLLKVGMFLLREEDNGTEWRNVMMIESRRLVFDIENGWTLTLTGGGIKNLLHRRIIWDQTTLFGDIESIIRQVVDSNAISSPINDRNFSNFYLADAAGITTDTTEMQLSGDHLSDWVSDICKQYELGWDIYMVPNGLLEQEMYFELYKGTDRTYDQSSVPPVVFSPQYDNLISSTLEESVQDYVNAGIVTGEGEGANQAVVSVGESSNPFERFEEHIDGSSVSSNGEIITMETYLNMLEEHGNEELKNHSSISSFDGEVIPNGMFKLNEDYFLGDLVQAENEFGIKAKARVIEIIFSEDQSGSSLVPTFSDWSV